MYCGFINIRLSINFLGFADDPIEKIKCSSEYKSRK